MDPLITAIRKRYANAAYAPPCTETEIAEAEELLGLKLPDDLRTMYRMVFRVNQI
jgi:cell wall assembly regulator SMI1